MNIDPAHSNSQSKAASPGMPLLSPFECQGALMPRLVHEMTNQLLIISGNAQIAERSDNDPLQAAQAVKAIRQASEIAGKLLDGYAGFLRRLPASAAAGSVSELASLIARNAGQNHGWRIDLAGPLAGLTSVDPRWIAFAVWQIVHESQVQEGEITLCCGIPRTSIPLTIPASAQIESNQMLQIVMNWRSPVPLLREDEMRKPKNLSLAVIYGLLSGVGGDCYYFFGRPDQNRFTLLAPLANASKGR